MVKAIEVLEHRKCNFKLSIKLEEEGDAELGVGLKYPCEVSSNLGYSMIIFGHVCHSFPL